MSTSSSTLIQTTVDADKRGRVTSLWAIGFFACAPIGALIEGELAKLVGPVHMFALAGLGCLVSALAFARALRLRGGPQTGPSPEPFEEPPVPDTF